jgi:hypothetical protein
MNLPAATTRKMGPARQAVFAGVAIGISLLVALAICEGVLRLFPQLLPEEAQLRLSWDTEEFEPQTIDDPYLGFRYPPNRVLTHRTHDFAIDIQTDEHGFRNPSPWPARAQVVVVGDSFAYGYGVREQDAWSRRVEQSLAPARVINLSLPGLGPEQYYRFLQTFGVGLQPKVVLYCLFPGNDVQDANRFREWQASGASMSFAAWSFLKVDGEPQAAATTFPHNLFAQSYLVLGLRSARKNLHSRFTSRTLKLRDGVIQLAPSLYEARMSEFSPRDPGFRATIDAVRETKQLTDQIGARLLVVLFPTKEEVYLPGRGASFPDMVTPVRNALKETSVDMLDLTEGLRKQADTDTPPLFFEVDGHLSKRGNAVVTELILQNLRDTSLSGTSE